MNCQTGSETGHETVDRVDVRDPTAAETHTDSLPLVSGGGAGGGGGDEVEAGGGERIGGEEGFSRPTTLSFLSLCFSSWAQTVGDHHSSGFSRGTLFMTF